MPQRQKLKNDDVSLLMGYAGLFVLLILVALVVYCSKRPSAQKDPYVARVNLQERYGGLEKRQVSIKDISDEQLELLRRDGKLTQQTILTLEKEGRLQSPKSGKTSQQSKIQKAKEPESKKPKKTSIKKRK
ncbi:hypothetical protein EDD86DRAFT_273651, partial [Gorgonomyces haynaldii]